MTFRGMLNGVAEEIRRRVQNGEITERGLARAAGLSQPHVHNVLKGARVMSPDSADRLVRALGLSATDLLWQMHEQTCPSCRTQRYAFDGPRRSAPAQARPRD